jgi:hypothetical protein
VGAVCHTRRRAAPSEVPLWERRRRASGAHNRPNWRRLLVRRHLPGRGLPPSSSRAPATARAWLRCSRWRTPRGCRSSRRAACTCTCAPGARCRTR